MTQEAIEQTVDLPAGKTIDPPGLPAWQAPQPKQNWLSLIGWVGVCLVVFVLILVSLWPLWPWHGA